MSLGAFLKDQISYFLKLSKINSVFKNNIDIEYNGIFGDVTSQIKTIKFFSGIEKTRLHLKDHLLPGGGFSHDPCKFNCILLDFAAD